MPIFLLNKRLVFPHPSQGTIEGVLAVGGDLSVERLLLAYKSGIFPWYSEGEPIIWWSPDPRFVLFPHNLKISKSMRQVIRRKIFTITYDTAFREVIEGCQEIPREGQDGTWITQEMLEAYVQLHKEGYAHSVEVWQAGKLVGGLYGVALGKCFFGESMFPKVSNASKAAFIDLTTKLRERNFVCIDCQQETNHLGSLGAGCIDRDEFLKILEENYWKDDLKGKWTEEFGK